MKLTFRAGLMAALTCLASSFAFGANIKVGPSETYTTIQAAITAANPGDTIEVAAGTYSEGNISVGKAITLKGPNAGLSGDDGSRGAEARIENSKLTITAAATIDGVEIFQTNDTADAVLVQSDATITNSIIRREGINAGTIARGLTTAVGTTGFTITDNLFTGDDSGGFFSGHTTWNSGMYVNGGSGSITGNTFENCRTAINADDFNAGITISGNTFRTSGTYLAFGGTTPTDGQFTISGNEFFIDWSDPVTNWLPSALFNNSNVAATFRLDVTDNTFGGVATSALTDDQKFHIEARNYHRGRSSRNGVVDFVENEQVVMPGTTIASAIDAADAGDTIEVATGTYTENLSIPKALTLAGPNAAISGVPGIGTRSAEAEITGTVTVTADNVTIAGLSLTNPTSTVGIYAKRCGGLTVENNIIHDINSAGTGSASGVYVLGHNAGSGNVPIQDITITGNHIHAIGSLATTVSVKGIYLGDSDGSSTVSNVLVQGNLVEDVTTTRGAYGIMLNYGVSSTGSVDDVRILDNIVTNLEGLWVHGIGLETDTANTIVQGNDLSDLRDNKTPSDAVGIFFEGNPSGASVVVSNNILRSTMGWGVAVHPADITAYGYTVDASANYWDSTDGPAGESSGSGTPVATNVVVPSFYADADFTNLVSSETWVDDDFNDSTSGWGLTHFATVQEGIAHTGSGGTINVAAGTYFESGQILIDKDLTIVGADAATVIIKPNHTTGGGSYAQENGWFAIEPGVTLNLSDVTLDGAGQTIKMAIIVRGTAVVEDCVIKNISSDQYLGWGLAILSGSDSIVRRCEFSNIQRIGVHIRGNVVEATPSALVDDCTFTGKGPGDWVEYGVEFGGGGSGTVQGCTFSGYRGVAVSDGSESAAILATDYYGNGTNAVVTGNTITDCTTGIVVGYDAPDLTELDANNNSISGCDSGVLTTANVVVTAAQNYWGAADGPSGAGQGSGVSVPANITFSPYFKNAAFTEAGPVWITTSPAVGYATIQGAIDAANANDVIEVLAGTYQEDITVNKALHIKGPNAGIAGNGVRGAEAVVHPATNEATAAPSTYTGEIFHVTASDVTIEGFVIDGDNPSLTSGYIGTNGADIDALEGVTVYVDNVENLTVRDNIIRNMSYFGVTIFGASYSAPATSGHLVSNNLIENFGTYNSGSVYDKWGGGVLLYNGQYARVENNTMENVRIGIQTGNFHHANPGGAVSQVITENTIAARSLGIFHNLHTTNASPYTVSNNDISAVFHADEVQSRGMLLGSLTTNSFITNNNIDLSAVTAVPSIGYVVWNVGSGTPTAISGGTITGASTGIRLDNYEGYSSDAGNGAHANVSNILISPVTTGTGIHVLDSPSGSTHAAVQLTLGSGVTVSGGTDGLVIEGANASQSAIGNLALTGQSGSYIKLIDNALDVDATSVQFDGKTGASMDMGELFAVEAKVLHQQDNPALGLVTWKTGLDVSTPVIADPQSTNDLSVPAGTTITITEAGSLEVTGKIELASGAEIIVNGGSLTLGDGSVISGTFTIFNSFGSWNINGDTTFTVNQTLALITDIHVAGGKTLTVNGGGELVLDGCVIDSQTPGAPYNIIADADGIVTMARSNVTDAVIDINTVDASVPANLRSRVYDNSFTNSDVEATADSRVYHNFFDTPTNTDSNTDTTTAFDAVDGWGNVTSVGELQNTFTLGFVLPGPGTYAGRTLDSDGNLFVQTDDPVGMTLDIGDLNSSNITGITAAEALLGYNSDMLTSPSVTPTTGPAVQDWEVIQTTMTSPSTLGYIDSALGLEFTTGPATGSVDNMTAATVNFTAGTAGYTYGFFRVQTDRVFDGNGVFLKDTRLTQYDPSAPGNWSYVAPYTSNTGSLVIDNAAPVINVASATATQDQPSFAGVDVLNGANPMFRQASDVVVTFNATDNGYGLSGLDAADADDDLVLEMVQGTNTQPLVLGTDYAITSAVDSSGVVTYSLAIAPSFATVSGTYELNAMVRDRSGNFSENTELGTFTVQNEALVNVELQGFAGASRDVTFVATINGVVQASWTKTVSNFANAALGSVILEDVPAGTTHISAKTAWNLRSKVALVGGITGQADATGADLLPGGDVSGDNVVNTFDYSQLRYEWLSDATVSDINGDGMVNVADYNIFVPNFYTVGDPE